LNAANEVAVQAFLDGQIRFTAIPQLIEKTLTEISGRAATQLQTILEDDHRAREFTAALVKSYH